MGDNFVRTTGDAPEVIKQQLFAWDSAERGQEVHMQGLPTHLELMRKKVEENKAKIKERQRRGASLMEPRERKKGGD